MGIVRASHDSCNNAYISQHLCCLLMRGEDRLVHQLLLHERSADVIGALQGAQDSMGSFIHRIRLALPVYSADLVLL